MITAIRPLLSAAAAAVILGTVLAGRGFPSGNMWKNRQEVRKHDARKHEVRNIIFMVPDGMGLGDVTAARIFRNGIDGAPLYLETLEQIGYQRTYSANSAITDSASAASAWACGEKFNNGEICFHGDGRPSLPGILELAKRKGMGTGLVATSTITHATPAAFGAHVVNRNCETEIARQYVKATKPDVLLGGGAGKFNPASPDACGTGGNILAAAEMEGYAIARTRKQMNSAVAAGEDRLLGLFTPAGMTPEILRAEGTTEPHLKEMTAAALSILGKNRKGFFLVVEGSQVDWANHANDIKYQVGETLAFDDAVKVVLDWLSADPKRGDHTLLIISPDHETGGFAIKGPNRVPLPGEHVTAGWTSGDHTGTDVPVWAQGPGSEAVGRALENTDLYRIMREALDLK